MTDTAVATRDDRPPLVVLRDRLERRKGELAKMLGNDIPPDQFIRAVISSATLNPDILACRWQSIWDACIRACRDNLVLDGVDAAIVPYKDRAVYIPMYQGLLRRFRRSGQFKSVTANVVRQGEEFVHFIDETGEHFRHVPGENFTAPVVKAYALATTKDGGSIVAVMPKAEVDKIRSKSRATRPDSPWAEWYEEMAKKTALRRLSKYLPSARDFLPDEEELIDTAPIVPQLPSKASVPSSVQDSPETGRETGGEQAQASDLREPPHEEKGSPQTDVQPAAADDSVTAAYQRGKEAKAAGHQRRALPPEYRTPDATRLALCWQAGFDDKPMPSFGKETS